jgi:hypothetical protein
MRKRPGIARLRAGLPWQGKTRRGWEEVLCREHRGQNGRALTACGLKTGRLYDCTFLASEWVRAFDPTQWEDYCLSFLNRQRVADSSGETGGTLTDREFADTYPALVEYLSARVFPDGTRRETSTMTVMVENGLFKVCLSDRQLGQVLWASSSTYSDLLLVLEAMLEGSNADWRRAKDARNGKK